MNAPEIAISITIMAITFIVCLPGALFSATKDLAIKKYNEWYSESNFF